MSRRLVFGMFAACAIFGGILVSELMSATDTGAPVIVPRQATTMPELPHLGKRATPDQLRVILDRPLFSSTRRPLSKTGQDPGTDVGLAGTRLSGILTARQNRLAIFAVSGNKSLVRVEGEAIGGWRIDHIAPGEVSLIGPSGIITLRPKDDAARTDAARTSGSVPARSDPDVDMTPNIAVPPPHLPAWMARRLPRRTAPIGQRK
jgi:hypothetical protein